MEAAVREFGKLHTLFSTSPIFGVEYTVEAESVSAPPPTTAPVADEDLTLTDDIDDAHVIAAYTLEQRVGDSEEDTVQFDPVLGLAVERLQDGLTLDALWRVV